MTADELNRRLAEALGWVLCEHIQQWRPWYGARDCDFIPVRDFSPARSVDDLRAYVLPEITRRELWPACLRALQDEYDKAEGDEWGMWGRWLLTREPAVLAEAALEVLKEEQ